ncbi:SLC22A4_5 [Mytilus coruscus]|uniref:SLC22A4_5 n=1 Tax=Mytilus coruscus TaxID=42192 RepID=A0A6J7ZXP1_MYTCO|nr:SLC22A4_5 [Mytilus coruscus]
MHSKSYFRCALPGWSNDTYEIQNEAHRLMVNLMIPNSTDETLKYSQCELIKNNVSAACNQWVYDKSIFKSTFTREQNLVCTDKLRTSHASMIFFGGVLAGAFGLGTLSDMIGRKKTLYLSSWLLLISTMAVAWAPSFWVLCIEIHCWFFLCGIIYDCICSRHGNSWAIQTCLGWCCNRIFLCHWTCSSSWDCLRHQRMDVY